MAPITGAPRDVAPAAGPDVGPVVLDGGMSNALEDRGHDLSSPLWTASLLADRPEEVAAVHRAYYEAGADVATSASYQASVEGFAVQGIDRAEAERLIRRSVRIAQQVRDELGTNGMNRTGGRPRLVAASVGPYGAMLADGSEYTGRYGVPRSRLREFHLRRLELLASEEPDLLAVETVPDLEEVEVLAELLAEVDLPAWLSVSAADGRTRAGQPLAEAFEAAASVRAVIAVGVNCCAPGEVLDAVRLARSVTDKAVVAYPNSGEGWDAARRTWTGDTGYRPDLAVQWVAAGASYVGGCCRVGPDHIARVARAVRPGVR
jgi:homocysteine S-methyltransferase